MAVQYDNSIGAASGTSPVTTGNFTIGSGDNRAAVVAIFAELDTDPGITGVTVGGQSGSLITSALLASGSYFALYGVINPAAGTQTASVAFNAYSGGGAVWIGCITVTGADQTDPFENEATAGDDYATTIDLALTSAAGDLTITTQATFQTDGTSNYTEVLSRATSVDMDYGPGTANPTHVWTGAGEAWRNLIGVSVKAAAVAAQYALPASTMAHYRRLRS